VEAIAIGQVKVLVSVAVLGKVYCDKRCEAADLGLVPMMPIRRCKNGGAIPGRDTFAPFVTPAQLQQIRFQYSRIA
jgi:hypothetical protein